MPKTALWYPARIFAPVFGKMRGFGTPNSANLSQFGTQILKKPQVRKLRVRTFGYQTPGFWKRTGTKPPNLASKDTKPRNFA